ncbi:GCK domain-containing protein [Euphorbia peplus]|nr:GCK domain-containing protein [Euphorbia peplus]
MSNSEGLDKTTESSEEKREEKTEGNEEEEGECGFCLFMKAGGCKDAFIGWEKCIEEAEKNKEDIVEKCFQVTGALKKCMEAHADYYEPILRAEEEEAKKPETEKSESNVAEKEK